MFRAGVDIVEVNVIATTENGESVGDLRRDELQVFQDGLRKEIVGFAHVYLPVRAPQLPGLVDVSTNADADRGRLFFLILDDANSGRAATATIQTVVRDLLSRLDPHDRVGMLWVSSKNQGAREFTTNPASIIDAVTTFKPKSARWSGGCASPLRYRKGQRGTLYPVTSQPISTHRR